jgi:hypothetical protein
MQVRKHLPRTWYNLQSIAIVVVVPGILMEFLAVAFPIRRGSLFPLEIVQTWKTIQTQNKSKAYKPPGRVISARAFEIFYRPGVLSSWWWGTARPLKMGHPQVRKNDSHCELGRWSVIGLYIFRDPNKCFRSVLGGCGIFRCAYFAVGRGDYWWLYTPESSQMTQFWPILSGRAVP